jgi:hypothetical protein
MTCACPGRQLRRVLAIVITNGDEGGVDDDRGDSGGDDDYSNDNDGDDKNDNLMMMMVMAIMKTPMMVMSEDKVMSDE